MWVGTQVGPATSQLHLEFRGPFGEWADALTTERGQSEPVPALLFSQVPALSLGE